MNLQGLLSLVRDTPGVQENNAIRLISEFFTERCGVPTAISRSLENVRDGALPLEGRILDIKQLSRISTLANIALHISGASRQDPRKKPNMVRVIDHEVPSLVPVHREEDDFI